MLCIYSPCFGQVLTVIDQESRLGLEHVVVQGINLSFASTTNAQGQVVMGPHAGSDSFALILLGYENLVLSYDDMQKSHWLVGLINTTFSLDHVVIVANRWQQHEKDLAQTHISLNQGQIQRKAPQTTADMLGQTGAVFIQKSQQGGGSPMIRGFAANRLLISVDEVRMNNAIFRSGNLQNMLSVDPFSLSRAEVLFGPASLMHGSDAIGGVMGFYTLVPQFGSEDHKKRLSIHAVSRYGTANHEKTGHIDMGLGGKRWAWVGSLSGNSFGDLYMGKYGPNEYLHPYTLGQENGADTVLSPANPLRQEGTGFNQWHLLQKVAWQPCEKFSLTYAFHHAATTNISRYDRMLRTRNSLPVSAVWYYGPQLWTMHHLSASWGRTGLWADNGGLSLAYQKFEESRHDRDYGSPTTQHRLERVDAWSLNLDLKKRLSGQTTVLYGWEGVYNHVNSKGYATTGVQRETAPARYPQADWFSGALYLNFLYKAHEHWHLEAGGRISAFALYAEFDTGFYPLPFTTAQLSHTAPTASLGISHMPLPHLKLKLNLSSGFRAPNVDDVGKVFDSEPGMVVVPNPGLGPEYAYSADLGGAWIGKDWIKVDLSAYYTHLSKAMVRLPFALQGQDSMWYDGEWSRVYAIQNAAYARVYGLQLGAEAKILGGWTAQGQFSIQHGHELLEDGTMDRLRHAAPWFGKTAVQYNGEHIELTGWAQFNGPIPASRLPMEARSKPYLYAKDASGNPYAPGWWTLHFRAVYQMYDWMELQLAAENILNRRYRPYGSGLAAPGFHAMLSAAVKLR